MRKWEKAKGPPAWMLPVTSRGPTRPSRAGAGGRSAPPPSPRGTPRELPPRARPDPRTQRGARIVPSVDRRAFAPSCSGTCVLRVFGFQMSSGPDDPTVSR